MIDKICNYIMEKIKSSIDNMDEERELVIEFGIKLIIGELPKIAILFIIGFLIGIGWYTVILFLLLSIYRSFVGGFHLKTHLGCMITTSILYLMPIILAKYFVITENIITYILTIIISLFSIFVIAKYAPADTENIPILSKKERKSKKAKAYISLAFLVFIILLNINPIISYMLIYGIFLEDLTTLPMVYKITNNKYGYEVYTQENLI